MWSDRDVARVLSSASKIWASEAMIAQQKNKVSDCLQPLVYSRERRGRLQPPPSCIDRIQFFVVAEVTHEQSRTTTEFRRKLGGTS